MVEHGRSASIVRHIKGRSYLTPLKLTIRNIAVDAVSNSISRPHHIIINYRCALGFGRAKEEPATYYFDMNDLDLTSILDEIIKQFAPKHGGRVIANGTIRCRDSSDVDVMRSAEWYITHLSHVWQ